MSKAFNSDGEMPEIEDDECTFTQTGRTFATQPYWHCRTCGMLQDCICSVCVKKCHEGHDVFPGRNLSNFCDCPDHGSCHCCSLPNIHCSNTPSVAYHCKTCNSDVCDSCSLVCHKGHDLSPLPSVPASFECSCAREGKQCKLERKNVKFYHLGAAGRCCYLNTNEEYCAQSFYHCRTCGLTGNLGMCEACAATCHRGHDIYMGSPPVTSAYCDCAAGQGSGHCKFVQK